MKQCKVCGCDFQPKNGKGVFCSKKCKQKGYRISVSEKLKMWAKMLPESSQDVQVELPKDYVEVKNIGVLSSDGSVKPLFGKMKKQTKRVLVELNSGSILTEYEKKSISERIEVLKKEIAKPPTGTMIPQRVYVKVRMDELSELESKIKNV